MSKHTEWLSLIEVSGPFLTVPLLEKAFPQGMETIETSSRARLRSAYDEWCDAIDDRDSLLPELHSEWIWIVITELLEYDSYSLISNSELSLPFSITSPGLFMPNWVVKSNQDENPRLFISVLSPETNLETVQHDDGWPNSFIERMTLLCRNSSVRLGLVTNGERWVLINAPLGETSSHASWYSRLWFQEPVTLKAFQSLLGVRRCFGPQDETLDALLEESLKHQDDVTDTLGEQVRRAVEVLIQCLDKSDQDRNRELLQNVTTAELYEAGLTVMMRLVFVLCAEERGLLLLGDHFYEQHYAISTLRSQLVEEVDRHGPEMLERRYDAWARLLAVFRMVFGGIDHESLRMPALGGSLFDPDKFPFLEGRPKGTKWLDFEAKPLPIDNRTVLLLLESLQILQQHGGALQLSYRALDVEQIGHVYEGLLEQTVVRVPEVTLGLIGSQKVKNPNVSLYKLELELAEGEQKLVNLIMGATERSDSAIRNALNRTADEALTSRLLAVCGGDVTLVKRLQPFIHLIRTDAWNDPIVYLANAFVVTIGVDRRETGTHYTPKSLTERIVANTLEPLVYNGPAEGKQREDWILKPSLYLLNLKICDPAMGSGAFLVQVCRWLAERIVESWGVEERNGKIITINGEVCNQLDFYEPMPKSLDERLIFAKRFVAEKCIYGVDLNPLAVELSKLSIWLVTMSKGRPFGFLDHNLRHGDSLMGIYKLDQLTLLSLNPEHSHRQLNIFSQKIEKLISEVVLIRRKMREISIIDIRDVEAISRLNSEAMKKLNIAKIVADALISEVLRSGSNSRLLEQALDELLINVEHVVSEYSDISELANSEAQITYAIDPVRKPFHWPLEFPEVFIRKNGGFDAIVGNPPFMGGRRLRNGIGDTMMNWLIISWPHASMNADLCAFFFLRAALITCNNGELGLLATKTIAQGDTARTGLTFFIEQQEMVIRFALSSFIWPGTASVVASLVLARKGNWKGPKYLDNRKVDVISSILDDQVGWGEAKRLPGNIKRSYQGSVLVGIGFVLSDEEAEGYLRCSELNQQVLLPYLGGEDLNTHPEQKASRWAIDFRNASLDECEEKWPELLEKVRQTVKPQRDKTRREAHRKYWWHHGDKRPALYEAIKSVPEVFVIARVTKYVSIVRVPSKQVFSEMLVVFDFTSWAHFAALQSSFHDLWVRRGSSTLGETLRYTPSDYFDTFPLLNIENHDLESVGQKYHDHRKVIMESTGDGLTDIYNRFHNPADNSEDIQNLRKLHREMDVTVARSFGWYDLSIQHDFHETKQGIRYSFPQLTRNEVLNRILKLNHACYDHEISKVVARGGKAKSSRSISAKKEKKISDQHQLTLFNIDQSK
ncbi:Eco57I restriction-modification methylase domain-containing protein [Paenibacillus sp. Soil522]|uniref:Eco57I restriction-modification methylase domain-containing protein n=1 Tax=Paenibacillus sp. Soil522 TaxID=1736388 RepID=UPI0006F2F338|nr:DNA methyltransferase [Paenibacillus sp. Soil522]KRE47405.1 TetR family transcriptional regulator [Paenibacillus sp. Soil522]